MFPFGILIGIYSYGIFSLGIVGLLYKEVLIFYTLFFIIASLLYFRNKINHHAVMPWEKFRDFDWLTKAILIYFILQGGVNLIGALGPELAFDALWYHLTLPKLYLSEHTIRHFPGGLLYYSDMPKMIEMIYTAALAIHSEILAKLVHFGFGLLTAIAIYYCSRTILDRKMSLLAAAIFYANPVAAWESTTAYIDLGRALYEVMAFWGLLLWYRTKKKVWFIESAVMAGLAISTKLLAFGSVIILLAIISLMLHKQRIRYDKKIRLLITYLIITLLIPLPWFMFAFINTGNPVYPFFTPLYEVSRSLTLLNPLHLMGDVWTLFTTAADPVLPIYLLSFVLIPFVFRTFSFEMKLVLLYSILSLFIWYITPRTGGGRFILAYLPVLSILVVIVATHVSNHVMTGGSVIKKYFPLFVLALCIMTLIYRGIANTRYLPVLTGKETKSSFLSRSLNFSFGDFYDTDGFFAKTIAKDDRVLLYGFHNLYYVNFPFVHASWVKKGDTFNYIAVQDSSLPKRFSYWNLIYQNNETGVSVYSIGKQLWEY
jgi:hypothetical protein